MTVVNGLVTKNRLIGAPNRALTPYIALMVNPMVNATTAPVAEEACIDRQIEEQVAKIAAGSRDAGDRREYDALLLRRAHLVFQMAISSSIHSPEYKRRAAG